MICLKQMWLHFFIMCDSNAKEPSLVDNSWLIYFVADFRILSINIISKMKNSTITLNRTINEIRLKFICQPLIIIFHL